MAFAILKKPSSDLIKLIQCTEKVIKHIRLFHISSLRSIPPVAAKLLVFPMWAVGFQSCHRLRRKYGTRGSSNDTKLTVLTKIKPFFLKTCSLNFCKLLVNF